MSFLKFFIQLVPSKYVLAIKGWDPTCRNCFLGLMILLNAAMSKMIHSWQLWPQSKVVLSGRGRTEHHKYGATFQLYSSSYIV